MYDWDEIKETHKRKERYDERKNENKKNEKRRILFSKRVGGT